MAKRRKNHKQFVLNREKVPIDRVLPGMIIEFQYRPDKAVNELNKGDPRPMVFVLAKERSKRLLHGINLNYLPQMVLQRMFTLISKKVPVEYVPAGKGINFIKGAYIKAQIPLGNKIIPKNLYEQVIKPKILNISEDYQSYRTYKIAKIGVAHVLNYKLNIHVNFIKEALEALKQSMDEETQRLDEEQNERDLSRQEIRRQAELERESREMSEMLKKSARKLPKSSLKKLMSAAAAKKMTKKGMDKKIDKKSQKKSTKPIKKKIKKKPTASKPKKTVRKVKTVKRKTTKKK